MINLSKSGDTIVFEFINNGHYLENGTIEVPVNSLSLVTDSSNMATFYKADSGDIFISATYDELGKTKAEMLEWFEENMVGGGGIDSGAVQTQIDQSISGFADSVLYDSTSKYVEFYHGGTGGTKVYEFDASDFVIDGMIDDVRIETISGVSYLVIDFNTASGKEDIQIPLTDIFDPSNYYTKTEVDGIVSGKTSVVNLTQAEYDALVTSGTVDPTVLYNITDATPIDMSQYWTSAETNSAITQAVSGKADTSYVDQSVSGKQDTLISGTNIKTINNESILGSGNIDIQGGGGGKAIEAGRGISVRTGATADTVSFNLPISATTNNNLIIGDESNGVNDLYDSGKNIVFGRYSKVKAYDSLVGGYNCSNEKGQSQAFGNYTKTKNQFEFGCGKYNNSVSGSSTFGDSGNTLFSVGNGTADNARHNAFEIRQNGDIYISSGGTDIKLQDNLGSGGGGGSITIDQTLDSGSTNAVANSAITTAINSKVTDINRSTADWVGNGVTTLEVTYNRTNSTVRTFCASINNKQILTGSDYSKANKFSLVETSAITTSISSSSTDAQVPSAKAVNDKLGGLSLVKLTQSEYDALATKDNSTLYVIVN